MTEELTQETPEKGRSFNGGRGDRWERLVGPIGAALLAAILIVAGELLVMNGVLNEIIVPRPTHVFTALIDTLSEGFFYSHLWVTTSEVLIGFVLGTIIGFSIGAALGISKRARAISYPYIVAFQGLPKIVLAPVFITIFGFGIESKVVMAIAISFFPVLINTMAGLTGVDPQARRLMRSLNASDWHIFTKLSLPSSLPMIFAGVKTGLTLSLVGAIVGEFVGAEKGLGYLLDVYSYQLEIPRVWAITAILAIIGVILFLAIEWVDRKIVFWQSRREMSAGM
ncbi:MAG: ABC transporter permease subunit [Acidimicrobiia bacterium]|nr:ABC transporter permease subunit [Acidimicrobiia bacterium]